MRKVVRLLVFSGFFGMLLSACASSTNLAPVIDVNGYEAAIQSGVSKPYQPQKVTRPRQVVQQEVPSNTVISQWVWPAQGNILSTFSSSNKGIDIGGRLHEPIYATAAGRVVYAGGGLRGYGELIIIKHNSQYISAYAHNSRIYVKAGDWVKKGQKIAAMGAASSDLVMLHFEIRKAGIPVNPLNILQNS